MLEPLQDFHFEELIEDGFLNEALIEHGFYSRDGRLRADGTKALDAWKTLKRGEKLESTGNVAMHGHMVPTSAWRPLTADEIAELRRICHLDMPS